jgi:septum formation protein
MRIILASASPRRFELLAQAGIACTVQPSTVDETLLPGEAAAAYVQRLAVEKAQAVCADLTRRSAIEADTIVLGADTAVVLPDNIILGKPTSPEDAIRMLELLSGRTHAVMTGIAAVTSGRSVSDVEITQVTMNVLLPSEIETYVASGEPLDKAGAYAIQGYAARWIPRIEGDYSNVVGLPLARVVALLTEAADPQGAA